MTFQDAGDVPIVKILVENAICPFAVMDRKNRLFFDSVKDVDAGLLCVHW